MASSKLIDNTLFSNTHTFSDGVYLRTAHMKAGAFVVGAVHKTTHLNIVLSGRASVYIDGELIEVVAPMVFESKAGSQKILLIHEDMDWSTVHATDLKDIDEIECCLKEDDEVSRRELLKNYHLPKEIKCLWDT